MPQSWSAAASDSASIQTRGANAFAVFAMMGGIAAFAAVLLYVFLGPVVTLAWLAVTMIASALLSVAVHRLALHGAAYRRHYRWSALMVTFCWVVHAILLWSTGEALAYAIAVTDIFSITVHAVFNGRFSQEYRRVAVGVPLAAFGIMLTVATWSTLPWYFAAPATVAGVLSIFSILGAARIASETAAELQRALAAEEANRRRMEFAIESIGDGYFEIDLETMIYKPNPRLATSLGFDPDEKDMVTLRDRIHPDDAPAAFAELGRAIKGELPGWHQDLRVRIASGGYRWMHMRARVLQEGGKRTLIGSVVNLDERKALEADLRASRDAAEASNRAKSEFLANMSHEIRTPLNGVLGMAQALEMDGLTDSQREKVGVILDSGKSLMALLNDVLDLSKIEAGKLEVSPVEGDLLHTIRRCKQLFQATADDKGLNLSVRFDSDFPQRLVFDPVRVRQCVSNLLSNAIKFTAKGSVDVRLSAAPAGAGRYKVSVDVRDTGIGMDEATQARLFSAFTQADGGITRKYGGSGLGLVISRHLARLMGGDLTVTSEAGRGSTFHLEFVAGESVHLSDAAPAPAEAPRPAARSATAGAAGSLRGVRVLLVDDNAINRQVAKLFLVPQGCLITEAQNGKEALDHLSGADFDIVLLDVHMPVMDGAETIRRIRASSAGWSSLPVIALTADAMSGDRERYLSMGMTDYVSKPIDQRELMSRMGRALTGAGAGETPAGRLSA